MKANKVIALIAFIAASTFILVFPLSVSAQVTIEPDTQHHLDPRLVHIRKVLLDTYGGVDRLTFNVYVNGHSNNRFIESELVELVHELGGQIGSSHPYFQIELHTLSRSKYRNLSREEERALRTQEYIHEVRLYRRDSGPRKLLTSYTTAISCTVENGRLGVCELDRNTIRELIYRLFDRLVR